jgi:hypothetical protein
MLGQSKSPCLFETKSKENEQILQGHFTLVYRVSMGLVTYEILNAKIQV